MCFFFFRNVCSWLTGSPTEKEKTFHNILPLLDRYVKRKMEIHHWWLTSDGYGDHVYSYCVKIALCEETNMFFSISSTSCFSVSYKTQHRHNSVDLDESHIAFPIFWLCGLTCIIKVMMILKYAV